MQLRFSVGIEGLRICCFFTYYWATEQQKVEVTTRSKGMRNGCLV